MVVQRKAGAQALTIGALTVEGADYRLDAAGDVQGLTTGFRVDGRIEGTAVDLSRFAGLAGKPV